MSTNQSAPSSRRNRNRGDNGSKLHPLEEMIDEMSISVIHGDEEREYNPDRI